MAKGIKQRIKAALKNVDREITGNASLSRYGAAMSGEGYAGGYRQALYDVLVLLDGHWEPDTRGYWEKKSSNAELCGGTSATNAVLNGKT